MSWVLVFTPLFLLILHDFFRYFLRPSWEPLRDVAQEFGWRRVFRVVRRDITLLWRKS